MCCVLKFRYPEVALADNDWGMVPSVVSVVLGGLGIAPTEYQLFLVSSSVIAVTACL